MMRRFYDLVAMTDTGQWAERLGYEKILTEGLWRYVETRKDLRKLEKGTIPVIRGKDVSTIKNAGWAKEALVNVQTKIDLQAAHLMKMRGQRAMYTLCWMRRSGENLRYAAKGIRILHRAKVPVILASGAEEVRCLAAPRDIVAVGVLLGMSVPMAYASVSTNWEGLI